jgi:outer membrane protein TolC
MSEHKIIRTLATGILLATGAFAQLSSFPKPNYFRETFKQVDTKIVLQPPARLRDFVKDGKLELSLKDYLGLAMANNTSIQIQYLSLERSRNSITSVYGLWDPTATASFSPQTAISAPLPSTPGAYRNPDVESHLIPLVFGYSQTLSTGQTISADVSGTKTSGGTGGYPSFNAGVGLSISQPLLRGRGTYITKIPLFEAESSYKQTGFNLTSNLLTLINSAENVYWNAISARETTKVDKVSLDAAQSNWDYISKQYSLGAVSYLDTYNPQQALAQAQIAYKQAQYNEAEAYDAVRNQIGVDLDPDIRKLPFNLTESVELPESEAVVPDKELEVQKALDLQPSLKSAQQSLDIDDLSLASANNNLLPSLSLKLGYSGAGNGGYYTGGFGSTYVGGPIAGGLGDALGQAWGFGEPTYAASLTLSLPIRNRTASMTLANALIQKRNDSLTVRNTQQSIRLTILNAVVALQSAIDSLELAKTEDKFSNLNYEAEKTKYALGNEIQQNVVLAQQELAAADLVVVNSKIALQKAILNLYTQTGELLDKRSIVVKTP